MASMVFLRLEIEQIISKSTKRRHCASAFVLPAAKATTSYASGKGELIARKEVDKIKTPY